MLHAAGRKAPRFQQRNLSAAHKHDKSATKPANRHLSPLCCARIRRGEELLRKRCGLDSPKPSVDLESPLLMAKLFDLFKGSPEPEAARNSPQATAAATAVADSHVVPAGVLLQSRLMSLFTKSTAAANHFPGTVQV